jgi:hypothetical protein
VSAVRILAPCFLILIGVLVYAWWPSVVTEKVYDLDALKEKKWGTLAEQQQSSQAGLLGSALVPASYETGEPDVYRFKGFKN